ncbi:MAG: PAS domain-containing protein [Chitinophagaceae bacterium]
MTPETLAHIKNTWNPESSKSPEKAIVEIVDNGFFTVDPEWTVQYWNKSAEKILGVSAADIVGRNLWSEFAGLIPVEFYSVYYKAFLKDIPVHFEEYWGEKGAWFDVVTYYSNDKLYVSFKSSDHSHTKDPAHLLQQLRKLSEFYRLVTEITNDCLWEWDLQKKEIFWIDGGHKRVFGYEIENAIVPQQFWENCLHPDDKQRMLDQLKKVLTGSETTWEEEYRFKKINGEYAFVHDRSHIIYDDNKNALRMIGATQDISGKVLLENKLVTERKAQQREIAKAIITAQEKERAEIGREMHDNLNQTLAVAKMYIQMAQIPGKNATSYLTKSTEYILKVISEIRKISKHLSISGNHLIGMGENIKSLIQDMMEVYPIKIEFHQEGIEEEDIGEKLQLAIFRIIQEQLNNIMKHANASKASIHLNREQKDIVLLISDNGDGTDLSTSSHNKGALGGVGIINIRSRADIFHGHVSIVSKPGEGYLLKVTLPVTQNGQKELAADL